MTVYVVGVVLLWWAVLDVWLWRMADGMAHCLLGSLAQQQSAALSGATSRLKILKLACNDDNTKTLLAILN